MAKGFYAQGIAVLFTTLPSPESIKNALQKFEFVSEHPASDMLEISGPSLLYSYRPDINGYITLDLQNNPWPDDMGDPQESPELFSAWSMGHYGPFAYPQNLSSAVQQSWHWGEAEEMVEKHKSFIRIRLSYIFGANEDAPIIPEGSDPLDELKAVHGLANALLQLPEAICLFNPAGENLMDKEVLNSALAFAEENNLPALNVWTNVRMFNVDPQWLMMDCVGNQQFDGKDIEVPFLRNEIDPVQVSAFIRDISLYQLHSDVEIHDRDTMDGPDGKLWRVKLSENSLTGPPRSVIRILPEEHYETFGS